MRRTTDKIRNAAQIDAVEGNHLWADRFDRDLDDVLAVQSEVARQVAKALTVTLKANENERLFQKHTTSMDAYDADTRQRCKNGGGLQHANQRPQWGAFDLEGTTPVGCDGRRCPSHIALNKTDIGRRMAAGAAWMVAMRFAIRAIGFVSTVMLARLLVPEDFGIVAIAMMVVGLLEAMSMFGFQIFLIRKQDAGRVYYDTAWSMSILRGLAMAAVLLLVAGLVSDLFDEPRVEQVMYVLALVAAVDALENVGVVDFRKKFQFHLDFAYMLYPKLGSFVVTIVLAVILRSYWALVIGILFGSMLRAGLSYVMHPYRPRFSLLVWREIFAYSKWLLANSVMRYAHNRGDTFFVAKFTSTQVVGLYAIAYEISNLALTELVAPIQRALLPGFSKLSADSEMLARNYADGFGLILLVALPVATGIGVTADLVVPILLGDKWAGAIPLVQILALCGAVRLSGASSGPLYQAIGKPQIITALLGLSMLVGLPALYFMSKEWGAIGAAFAATFTAIVYLACNMIALVRYVGIPGTYIMAAVWRSVLSALLLVSSVLVVRDVFNFGTSYGAQWLELGTTVLTGAVSYCLSIVTLWWLAGRPRASESLIFDELWLRWARVQARQKKGKT